MKYFLIALTIIFILPATVTAKQGAGSIPVMPGAKIIKQSTHKGSGRLELTTKEAPVRVANFYRQAMKRKGWPAGTVMTTGNSSALMLYDKGQRFALKAIVKNGMTKVIMTLIQKKQTMAATKVSSKIPTASSRPLGSTSRPLSQRVIQPRGKVQHLTQGMQINSEDTRPASSQTSPLLYPDFEVTGKEIVVQPFKEDPWADAPIKGDPWADAPIGGEFDYLRKRK